MSGTSVLKKLQQALFKSSGTQNTSTHQDVLRDEHNKLIKEALKKMNSSEPLQSRVQFLKEFCDYVKAYKVDDVRILWTTVQDLVANEQTVDVKETGLQFMCSLIEGQYTGLGSLRVNFFEVIESSTLKFDWRLKALTLLTKGGRDVSPFEKELGYLLLQWLSDIAHLAEVLTLLTNVIKYNFAALEEPAKAGIVKSVCLICNNASSVPVVEACINFFDVLVRYGTIPSSCLLILISSLCRTVNIESFCKLSWQIMTNILRSHYGHQGVDALCSILNDPNNHYTVNLLRGAVFFLGMSIWGSQRITSLHTSPATVLPSFLNVLSSKQNIVAYEVLLAISRLVKKFSHDLRVEWDIIISIFYQLKTYLGEQENTSFVTVFGETITSIGELSVKENFFGSRKQLNKLLLETIQYQSETFVLYLLDDTIRMCQPVQEKWIDSLHHFMHAFFINEERHKIRLKALNETKKLYHMYKDLFGDEIIDIFIVPYFAHIYLDTNIGIRQEGIDFLIDVAKSCNTSRFSKLLEILERALSSKEEISRRSAIGLLSIFKSKFYTSHYTQTLFVYTLLVKHIYGDNISVRKEIFSQLLLLRADYRYHVMLDGKPSAYLRCCSPKSTKFATSKLASSQPCGWLQMSELYNAILYCFQHEPTAELFLLVTSYLIKMLRNRYIFFGLDIGKLASLLCGLLARKSFGECASDLQGQKKEELYEYGFQIVSILVGYQNDLTLEQQREIADTLTFGAWNKWSFSNECKIRISRTCVLALSIALYEFQLSSSYIPKIIDNHLQMLSTAPGLASNIMEFLILLSKKPRLVFHLTSDDFEKTFKVILQLTDPKKFPMTPLAYHALACWYLATPVTLRPTFFTLVAKVLANHIKERSSLLAESSLDFMARYTYTDQDINTIPSKDDSIFDSAKRSWMQGNSIVTIKTGKMGWSQVTVRRASGSTTWVMHLQTNLDDRTRNVDSSLKQYFNDLETLPPLLQESLFSIPPIPDSVIDSPKIATLPLLSIPKEDAIAVREHDPLSPSSSHLLDHQPQNLNLQEIKPIEDLDSSLQLPSIEENNIIDHSKQFPPIIITLPEESLFASPIETSPSLLHAESQSESVPIRKSSGTSSSEVKSPNSVSLFAFYPPLPSYEAEQEDAHSPSLIKSIEDTTFNSSLLDVEHLKLSLDAQMLLHSNKTVGSLSPPSIELASFRDSQLPTSAMLNATSETITPPTKLAPITEIHLPTTPSIGNLNNSGDIIFDKDIQQEQNQLTESLEYSNNANNPSQGLSRSTSSSALGPTSPGLSRSLSNSNITASVSMATSILAARRSSLSPPPSPSSPTTILNPNLIFLQMQQVPFIEGRQRGLKSGEALDRALGVLDRTLAFETHKIGLLYIGEGQTTEEQILSNQTGSARYHNFLHKLGTIVRVADCIDDGIYNGGLAGTSDTDGEYSLLWKDNLNQVMFHVATMMPNLPSDKSFTNKKSHIGNDYVIIIYSDSRDPISNNIISGQFNFVNIMVYPRETGYYMVEVRRKPEVPEFGPLSQPQIVTEEALIPLVRQTAIFANYASLLALEKEKRIEFTTNFEERLRQIKQISSRFAAGEDEFIDLNVLAKK